MEPKRKGRKTRDTEVLEVIERSTDRSLDRRMLYADAATKQSSAGRKGTPLSSPRAQVYQPERGRETEQKQHLSSISLACIALTKVLTTFSESRSVCKHKLAPRSISRRGEWLHRRPSSSPRLVLDPQPARCSLLYPILGAPTLDFANRVAEHVFAVVCADADAVCTSFRGRRSRSSESREGIFRIRISATIGWLGLDTTRWRYTRGSKIFSIGGVKMRTANKEIVISLVGIKTRIVQKFLAQIENFRLHK